MPGVPADLEVSFGSEVLAAYMRMGLSNSCTSRPAFTVRTVPRARQARVPERIRLFSQGV
jgi:hypothetical protein